MKNANQWFNSGLAYGILALFLFFSFLVSEQNSFAMPHGSFTHIEIPSTDGITVYADFYPAADASAPVVLLCHQAQFSKGEYRTIAPELQKKGYHVIAIDQRSGKSAREVPNKTAAEAEAKGLAVEYPDALPDVLAAVHYIKKTYPANPWILWGSSYSASLAFIVAQKEQPMAVLSWSPGEYFTFEDRTIADWGSSVECPIFITSSQEEAPACKAISQDWLSEHITQFIPAAAGIHGSKALWPEHEGNAEYWDALWDFLESLKG